MGTRASSAVSRADVFAVSAAFLVPLVLYRHAVFGGEIFFDRDINSLWHGQVVAFVRAVASGAWPVWDPWRSFGEPMWAQPTQVPYPWFWLNLLVLPGTFYTLSVIAHAAFGIAGMYGLARRFGLSRTAGAVAGACWAACGPVVSTTDMLNLYVGTGWLPWILLACEAVIASGRPLHAALLGACLAAPVLGGSEVGLLAGALVALWVLAHVRWREPWHPANRRLVAVSALALVCALLLSAPQWVPTLELIHRSARQALSRDLRVHWSVHPLGLLQIVLPMFPAGLPMPPDNGARDELQGPFLASIHLGIPLLALLAASAFSPQRARVRLLGVAAAASLAVGMGRYFVAYDLLALLPVVKSVRFPVKALLLTAFCSCLLAAFGVDAWREGTRTRRWRASVAGPALFCTLLAAAGLMVVGPLAPRWAPRVLVETPGHSYGAILHPTTVRLWIALALGAVTSALAWRRRAVSAVSLCAVLALVAAHHDMVPTAPAALYTSPPPLLQHVRPGARVYGRRPRAGWDGPTWDPFFSRGTPPPGLDPGVAVAVAQRQALTPIMAPVWGLSGSYEPDGSGVQPAFQRVLFEWLDATDPSPAALRLLQVGAVDSVVALDTRGLDDLVPVASRPDAFGDVIHLFAVPGTLSRAYVVGGSRVADGPAAVAMLIDAAFDPRREVVLAAGEARAASPAFQGTTQVRAFRADALTADVTLSDPGYFVMVDLYDPNWTATVDGAPAIVQRANVAFRAVAVPAGRHVVSLRYRPRSVAMGLALGGLGVLMLVVLAAREARRSEEAPQPGDLPQV